MRPNNSGFSFIIRNSTGVVVSQLLFPFREVVVSSFLHVAKPRGTFLQSRLGATCPEKRESLLWTKVSYERISFKVPWYHWSNSELLLQLRVSKHCSRSVFTTTHVNLSINVYFFPPLSFFVFLGLRKDRVVTLIPCQSDDKLSFSI